ncbi:MAG: glutamine amidotransferase [Propionibacteriaceae bacterium]|nr:glutamine amidotransferase [Propionibacteriaceae bacterium]
MKPFVLLSCREDDTATRGEAESIRQITGLTNQTLVQVRLEREPMPVFDIDEVSGFIIGGSDFCASSEEKSSVQGRVEADLFALLDRALETDIPVLGLCYGLGVLATHLGGTVGKAFGEEISAIPVTLTSAGQADPLFEGSPDCFHAFVGHKESVEQAPRDAVVLATGADCPVQVLRAGSTVYAAQYHPELDAEALVVRMEVYKHNGYFDPDEFDAVAAAARGARVDGYQHLLLSNFVSVHAR